MNIKLAIKNKEANPEAFEKVYGDLVNDLVLRKYPMSAQIAILRQRDSKPDDFATFNDYVEECKVEAKDILGIT